MRGLRGVTDQYLLLYSYTFLQGQWLWEVPPLVVAKCSSSRYSHPRCLFMPNESTKSPGSSIPSQRYRRIPICIYLATTSKKTLRFCPAYPNFISSTIQCLIVVSVLNIDPPWTAQHVADVTFLSHSISGYYRADGFHHFWFIQASLSALSMRVEISPMFVAIHVYLHIPIEPFLFVCECP